MRTTEPLAGGPTEGEAGYSVSHSHYIFNGFGLGFYCFGGGDFTPTFYFPAY